MQKDLESCRLELQQLNNTLQKSQLETAIQIDKYKQKIADLREKTDTQVKSLKKSLTEKMQQARELMQQAVTKAEEFKANLQQKVSTLADAQTTMEKMNLELEALKKKFLETLTENEQLKKTIQKLQDELQAAAAAQPPKLPTSPKIE